MGLSGMPPRDAWPRSRMQGVAKEKAGDVCACLTTTSQANIIPLLQTSMSSFAPRCSNASEASLWRKRVLIAAFSCNLCWCQDWLALGSGPRTDSNFATRTGSEDCTCFKFPIHESICRSANYGIPNPLTILTRLYPSPKSVC